MRILIQTLKYSGCLSIIMALSILGGCGQGDTSSGTITTLTDPNSNVITVIDLKKDKGPGGMF